MIKITYILILTLLFASPTYSQSDSIKSLVEKSNSMNLDMWELTDFAKQHITDKNQLPRFFYYWIGSNIKYDEETFQNILQGSITNYEFGNRQSEYYVYENRKGVCAGYANLFKWFMDEIDVEVVIIPGYIRDERNHYVELLSDDNFRHAWNAIKLRGKWILVDTTWGTSNDSSQSEFYFDIKPEWAIISHYPEDNKWQLLKEPLTLEQFNNSKFVKPIWFFAGFLDIPKLMEDEEYYYFVFKENPNSKWSVSLLYSSDNINFEPISGIDVIIQDGYINYRFNKTLISDRAFFKVNISEMKQDKNQYSTTWTAYEDVINFKI
jgi:transglutaminase/protease-like cytokinesis protein 3